MPIPSGMRIGYGGWLEPKKKKNGKDWRQIFTQNLGNRR